MFTLSLTLNNKVLYQQSDIFILSCINSCCISSELPNFLHSAAIFHTICFLDPLESQRQFHNQSYLTIKVLQLKGIVEHLLIFGNPDYHDSNCIIEHYRVTGFTIKTEHVRHGDSWKVGDR